MSILNKMFPSAFQILLKRIVIYALCITFTHSIAQNPNNFDLVRKRAQVYKVNGKAGLNLGKKNLVPPLFDSLAPLKKGFVKVYNKDKVGVYEIGKGQVVPMLYDDLSIVNDTLLLSLLNHKRGLLSLSNKILLEPNHKAITVNGYGNTIVENFKKFKILSGERVIEVEGDSLVDHYHQYRLHINDAVEFINKSIDSVVVQKTLVLSKAPTSPNPIHFGDKVYGPFSCDTLFKGLFESSYFDNDSLLIYKTGMKFGLANIAPDILTTAHYDTIYPLTRKFLKFKTDEGWGIMNRRGQVVTDTLFDCLEEVPSHKYCKATLGGREGLISYNGHMIVPPTHSYILKDSSENIYTFFIKDVYLAIVDTSGMQLLDTNYHYQHIGKFRNGFAKVKKFNKYGFINKRGGLTIATQYLKVCDRVVEERASVMIKGKWALVDSWEKMLAQPYYDSIGHFYDSVAIAVKNRKYLLLSYYGKELCGAKFQYIKRFDKQNFLVQSGGRYGVMRKDGNEIVFTKYDEVLDINPQHIVVKNFGKVGLLSYSGKEIVPMDYDHIFLSDNDKGYVLVKNVSRSIVKY